MLTLMNRIFIVIWIAIFGHSAFGLSNMSEVENIAKALKNNRRALFPISLQGDSDNLKPVFVIIQGIDFGNSKNWHTIIDISLKSESTVYFFKINKRLNAYTNQLKLEKAIRNLFEKYSGERKIHLIAFSTGGVLSLANWEKYMHIYGGDLELTTVAAPVAGYAIAKSAYPFIRLFRGSLTAFVVHGIATRINGKNFNYCSHIINTSCDLDKHSCPRNSCRKEVLNPQEVESMPCPNIEYIQKGHHEALDYAVQKILKL